MLNALSVVVFILSWFMVGRTMHALNQGPDGRKEVYNYQKQYVWSNLFSAIALGLNGWYWLSKLITVHTDSVVWCLVAMIVTGASAIGAIIALCQACTTSFIPYDVHFK